MIVLNSPKSISPFEMKIMKKESIDLLVKMVVSMKLNMKECYITNLVKCESGDIMLKPSTMIKNCLPIFAKEMENIKPRAVLVMGDILPIQDIVHNSSGVEWFNIAHPINLIHDTQLKRSAWNTMQDVMRYLSGETL